MKVNMGEVINYVTLELRKKEIEKQEAGIYKKLMAFITEKIKGIEAQIETCTLRNEKLPDGLGYKLYVELEVYLGVLKYLDQITEE